MLGALATGLSPGEIVSYGGGMLPLLGFVMIGVNLAVLVVVLAGAVRRLHDQGDRWIGLLVVLIPLVGWVLFAIVMMTPR